MMNYESLVKFDALAVVMLSLVFLLGISISCFAYRYLNSEPQRIKIITLLIMLILSTVFMVVANNLYVFLLASLSSNIILSSLMIYNSNWQAARYSGFLAYKNFLIVFICMSLAFIGFYLSTDSVTISDIVKVPSNSWFMHISLILLVFAAVAQSAIMPFHRWILSSLNSPTPVSAIMHAGIINGGGFMLARFSPLFINCSDLLALVFIMGLFTALLGTTLKLLQHDLKRMLACSTIGQMGFMFMQCGLGLFPNAIAHLCLHGMFKAYLFLDHANLAFDDAIYHDRKINLSKIIYSIIFGVTGSICFAKANQIQFLNNTTVSIQTIVALLLCSQIAITLFSDHKIKSKSIILGICCIAGFAYGGITHFFEFLLSPMNMLHPTVLTTMHWLGLALLIFPWILLSISKNPTGKWSKFWYVKLLNLSQPHPMTITSVRQNYQT